MQINFSLLNYVVAYILLGVTLCVVGLFVFLQRVKPVENIVFAIYSLSISWWSFFTVPMIISENAFWAYRWDQVCLVGAIFIPATFIHFVIAYTQKQHIFKTLLKGVYALAGLFLVANISGVLLADVRPKGAFNFYTTPNIFYTIYVVYFSVTSTIGIFLLFLGGRDKELPVRKRRSLKGLFFFSVVGYFGGSSNFLLVYDIAIPYLGVIANYLILVYVVAVAYLILQHRFLDIEVIIKRTIVFTGILGMVMAVVIGVTTVTQAVTAKLIAVPSVISTALSVMLALIFYDPTRKILINVTDKYLFQKKSEIKIILNRLSEEVVAILNLNELGMTIVKTLKDALRLDAIAVLVKDEAGKQLDVLAAQGVSSREPLLKEDLLIQYLAAHPQILNFENHETKNSLPLEIQEVLKRFQAHVALPLFFQKDLIGVLFLGKKKSDQDYTQEEIDYFPTVASQAALAIRNAKMYDTLMKSQVDFSQQAKMAAIGTLSAGIGHEVKNPLNNIRGAVGMLKLNRKHQVYEGKPADAILSDVFEALEVVESNVDRATDIINRLQSFAKKPKDLKVERVNASEAMEAALSFVSNQLELNAVRVVKNIKPDCLIAADKGAIEDALLNLITNAAHAMKGSGILTLSAVKQNAEVELVIEDTGSGIAPENLEKIFDPFFTTKDTTRNPDAKSIRGTGLGLFIVREIIKRFGGTITIDSEIGRGTAFRIRFPAYQAE